MGFKSYNKSKRNMFKNRTVEEKIQICKNRIKKLNYSIEKNKNEIKSIKYYMKVYLKYGE